MRTAPRSPIVVPDSRQQSDARIRADLPGRDIERDAVVLMGSPSYNSRLCNKRRRLLLKFEGLRAAALTMAVSQHNQSEPHDKVSVSSIYAFRKLLSSVGLTGLIGNYGRRGVPKNLVDEIYPKFRKEVLRQGAPDAFSCWCRVKKAVAETSLKDMRQFPPYRPLLTRLHREVSRSEIRRIQIGEKAFAERSTIQLRDSISEYLPGQAWAVGHFQVNCKVYYYDLQGRFKTGFPWCTLVRDCASGKWLGWVLETTLPTIDSIYSAFFRAAGLFPVCSTILIDGAAVLVSRNSERSIDQRPLAIDQDKVRTDLALVGVKPVFTPARNQYTAGLGWGSLWVKKEFTRCSIPRQRQKALLFEPMKVKYARRPLIYIKDFESEFEAIVSGKFNKRKARVGRHAGRFPDEIWAAGLPESRRRGLVRKLSLQAVCLFCARTPRLVTVVHYGVRDSENDVVYCSKELMAYKGRKIYLRRDPKVFSGAWVFDAASDRLLCRVPARRPISRRDSSPEPQMNPRRPS